MRFYTIMLLLGTAMPLALADCCTKNDGVCGGGREPTPCCGVGSCNMFCCECHGGCWPSRIENRYDSAGLFERDADLAFLLADKSGNGTLSFEDYLEYMNVEQGDEQMWATWFQRHDKNGDGFITIDEIRLAEEES